MEVLGAGEADAGREELEGAAGGEEAVCDLVLTILIVLYCKG